MNYFWFLSNIHSTVIIFVEPSNNFQEWAHPAWKHEAWKFLKLNCPPQKMSLIPSLCLVIYESANLSNLQEEKLLYYPYIFSANCYIIGILTSVLLMANLQYFSLFLIEFCGYRVLPIYWWLNIFTQYPCYYVEEITDCSIFSICS